MRDVSSDPKYCYSIGKKFNMLTLLKVWKPDYGCGRLIAEVLCECGTKRKMTAYTIMNGKTKSCGCLRPRML